VGFYVDANDELLFEFNTGTSAANIYLLYEKNNGGVVSTDTGVDLVAAHDYVFRIKTAADGSFKAYIDGVLVKTGAAGAIRAVAFKPYIFVKDTAVGHPGVNLSVDYVKTWQNR